MLVSFCTLNGSYRMYLIILATVFVQNHGAHEQQNDNDIIMIMRMIIRMADNIGILIKKVTKL